MKISELKLRENVYEVLALSLSSYFLNRHNIIIDISTKKTSGQAWNSFEFLSALYNDSPSKLARNYLSAEFCHTPIWYRRIPQYFLGKLLTTSMSLFLFGKDTLWVDPPLPDAQDSLIIPGNKRIRLFNFVSGKVTAIAKIGYDDSSFKKEISIRYKANLGPFLPISSADNQGRWFEEPIVSGFSLPRCPPFLGKQKFENEAVANLSSWQEQYLTAEVPSLYIEKLVECIKTKGETARSLTPSFQFKLLNNAIQILQEKAAKCDLIELVFSHGDFQPGNVLVDRVNDKTWIIDWEYEKKRSRYYDFFVWYLFSRYPFGLKNRFSSYIKYGFQNSCGPLETLKSDFSKRLGNFAIFLLEELEWHLNEDIDPANSLHGKSGTEQFLKALPF